MTDDRILFGGLFGKESVPKNYKRLQKRHGATDDGHTFNQVLNQLGVEYGIEWRDLMYDAEVDASTAAEMLPVDHYRALVNPAWEGIPSPKLPGDREDAVWHIPTKKYTRVNHEDVWRPLFEAIEERGEGGDVFGTCRLRRQGGEVHIDVFFENAGLDVDGEDFTLGISTGHDYYGNVRLYVDVVAYHDTGDGVGQVMRYLVDPRRRKHTGSAGDEVVNWYDTSVSRLEKVSDKMYNIVADAMHYEVPLGEMPGTITDFYEHLGLPNRAPSELADPAAERAVKMAVGPYTAWHLYKAGMWAIEHKYDSRDTSAFKSHVNTVNTLLFNPSLAEKRVLSEVESEIEEKRSDEDADIYEYLDSDPDVTLESIRTRAKSISEGVEEFEDTKDRLRKMLQDEGVKESEEADLATDTSDDEDVEHMDVTEVSADE